MAPNPYIMAADNSPALLPLLREQPALARQQDDHGYSLVHAAASYDHLDLLRTLVRELHVPVDLRDEDRETALFVVESVAAARCLVEELGLDPALRGADGLTAAEKLAAEGDFPEVAAYLQTLGKTSSGGSGGGNGGGNSDNDGDSSDDGVLVDGALPSPPPGMTVRLGTMPVPETSSESIGVSGSDSGSGSHAASASEQTEEPLPDPALRRRIEELAARPDFHTEEGQAALRELVEEVLGGTAQAETGEGRNVRARQ